LLQKYIKTGDRVFDLGTGSGILAVAAAKLGAREVLAVDTDTAAVEIAQETIQLNNLAAVIRVCKGSIEACTAHFDLVLANIFTNELIRLAPTLARIVRPSGVVILSGVVSKRVPDVRGALCMAGFQLLEERSQDGWHGFVFGK
jgi:ribosomal protein L11 methyltransferase